VALPALSGLQGHTRALTRTWRRMLAAVFAANAAAALLLLLFAGSAVRALVGERWLPAVPLMRILAVAMVFRAVIILTGQLLDALGRPGLTLRLNAARLAVLVLLMPPLAAGAGAGGIAAAVLGASVLGAGLALWLSGRLLAGWSGEVRVRPAPRDGGVEHAELVP
jgi:PST family polysaccharide transporter/lipopolysaccharide exporter